MYAILLLGNLCLSRAINIKVPKRKEERGNAINDVIDWISESRFFDSVGRKISKQAPYHHNRNK